jgi:hypothetical protein
MKGVSPSSSIYTFAAPQLDKGNETRGSQSDQSLSMVAIGSGNNSQCE